jgi:ribonuclease HI
VSNKICIYTDGGCWPNPGGDMLYAYSVFNTPITSFNIADDIKDLFIGNGALEYNIGLMFGTIPVESSNNVAEYAALLCALHSIGFSHDITIFSDSLMLVKQMSGEYKVNNGRYKPVFENCIIVKNDMERKSGYKVDFKFVSREKNISGVALEIFRKKLYGR